MLGVSWTEMLVIGVVALIVIGPKELPGLMNKIGKFAGTVRRMGADFQRELNKTTGLDEVKNLRNAITQPLKQTTDAIRKEFNATTSSGAVQPSGVLKPADPKAESVVDEIHKAAGLPAPAEPVKGTPVKAATTPTVIAPAKGPAIEPMKAAAVAAIAPSTASPPTPSPNLDPAAKPKRVRKPKAAASTTATPAAPKKAPAKKAAAASAEAPRKRKPAAKKTS